MRTPMFAVVLVAALVSARPAEAQSYSPDPRTPLVSATGSGEISRPPDYVVVAVGLLAHGSSPGGTSAELDRLLGEVRDSLRARALPDSSVIVGVRTIEPQRTFPER